MRDIKFRVWHKPTNQFVRCHPVWNDRQYKDLGLLSLTSDGELIFETMYDGFQRLSSSNEVDDFIVQQYTGLKDKNGVEICEGDMLLWEQGWMYPEMNGEIKWVENGYHFVVPKHDVKWLLKKSLQSAKIIGNIFEGVDK